MTHKEICRYVQQLAKKLHEVHKKSVHNWTYGEIEKVWFDKDMNICIQYQSGDWWHYNDIGEWW